ncbi:MAG: hypothetical protein JWO19_1897 [Bryobacterales bacterium]|nr:hypothetical protein [Bryobacterales bacterium]
MTVTRKIIVVLAALFSISAVLFVVQGGFGGGHGRFDWFIGIVGLPWILLPWPEGFVNFEPVWLLAAPFLIDILLVLGIAKIVKLARGQGRG